MLRLTALLVLAMHLRSVSSQMGMGPEEEEMMEAMGIKGQPMGRKNLQPQAEIFKKDLKYINCNVCRIMVDIAYDKSKEILEKRFKFQKKRKHDSTEFDGEGAVQEFVEKLCNPLKPEGEWVTKIDLKEEKGALALAQQPTHGKCNKELHLDKRVSWHGHAPRGSSPLQQDTRRKTGTTRARELGSR